MLSDVLTIESIQSGVYYGVLGACRELITRIHAEAFAGKPVIVLATGGFASLFDKHDLYDQWVPDLVLQGIRLASLMNHFRFCEVRYYNFRLLKAAIQILDCSAISSFKCQHKNPLVYRRFERK